MSLNPLTILHPTNNDECKITVPGTTVKNVVFKGNGDCFVNDEIGKLTIIGWTDPFFVYEIRFLGRRYDFVLINDEIVEVNKCESLTRLKELQQGDTINFCWKAENDFSAHDDKFVCMARISLGCDPTLVLHSKRYNRTMMISFYGSERRESRCTFTFSTLGSDLKYETFSMDEMKWFCVLDGDNDDDDDEIFKDGGHEFSRMVEENVKNETSCVDQDAPFYPALVRFVVDETWKQYKKKNGKSMSE